MFVVDVESDSLESTENPPKRTTQYQSEDTDAINGTVR